MKISTKGRYGLKAALDLAMYASEEAVSLSSVAQRQDVSISYLEQLIAKLKKAGIVTSIRGAQGGYMLARPAEEISVGEILRALEGDLYPINCQELNGVSDVCKGADVCVTKYVWKRISDSISEAVDNINLGELAKEGHRVREQEKCKE